MPEPPAAVVVRDARTEDLTRIVELLIAGSLVEGKEDPALLPAYEAALAEITRSGSAVLVAEPVGGGPVLGVCQLIVFTHLQAKGGRCAEIESLHVHPHERARGIGGTLLEAAVARARDLGCYKVQLTSNNVRVDAHRFYDRHGFDGSHTGFKRVLQ